MMFSSSTVTYIATVLLVLPATIFAQNATEAPTSPITPSYHYDMYRNSLSTCFDYRSALGDIPKGECNWHTLFNRIREEYEIQSKANWALKWHCHGGLTRDLMTLTGVDNHDEWVPALEALCADAIATVTSENIEKDASWNIIKDAGVDMREYFAGGTFLNDEYGNLQQKTSEFERRGGYDRYIYIGEDPRLNDYFPTTEESYQGGVAIKELYAEAESKFLAPPGEFNAGSCDKTAAAMCCWSKDRQYNDNNGDCSLGHCIDRNPGDNTDLCWIEEDDGSVFPYPNAENEHGRERDLHCHGLSWSALESGFKDTLDANSVVNDNAKWNNLYFVSLYDHLYQRGYVDSVTEAAEFMGEQAMCGCVEDMNPVARADCTEAIGLANYTFYQDETTGELKLDYIEDSFEIEFRACQGWQYKADITPESYQGAENINRLGLRHQTNDLSAHVFRQYLEGRTDATYTDEYEKVVVGYKHPEVNQNDNEREKVCKAKFDAKFPEKQWKKVVQEEEEVEVN